MNMNDMLKQAQKMQSNIAEMQEKLKTQTVQGQAGGSMVTVTINGAQEILNVKIEPSIIESDDIEMLEDLLTAAVNDALSKVKKMMENAMQNVTGGLNIPGLF